MSDGKAYDLAVIGSGTAAQVVSFRVRAAGWSVAVVDHLPFGGTCALRGCDPKKMLISGAEAIDMARRMRGRGVTGEIGISWPDLIAFKRSFTDPVPANHERRYAERGIAAFHGRARFTGRNTIEVDGQILQARHVLIATGARPVPLTFPGAEHLITSDQFLELAQLPARIVMVGGGYIAAELSHIAARAGAKVTVLQRADRMLTQFDSELVGWLMEKFAEIGVEVRTGTAVEAVERAGGGFTVHARAGNQEFATRADLVVHAAGRAPDLAPLDLASAGVAVENGIGVKSPEREREAHVVHRILRARRGTPLHDDIPDVATGIGCRRIQRRGLAWFPAQHQIARLDPPALHQEAERPGAIADDHDPRQRWHRVVIAAMVQEGLGGPVIPGIRVSPVSTRAPFRRHHDQAFRETLGETLEGLDPRCDKRKLFPNQFPDNGFAEELLPPALGLAIVHDEIGVAQLPGRAEAQHPAIDAPIEHHRRVSFPHRC